MSYQRANVTRIEDLPNLEDLDGIGEAPGPPDMSTQAYPQAVLPYGNYQYHEDVERDKIQHDVRRIIRPTQMLPPESKVRNHRPTLLIRGYHNHQYKSSLRHRMGE